MKLRERFVATARANQTLTAAESKIVEQANVSAIRQWGNTGDIGLEEKIQVLDMLLTGIWGLGESGGKYARVLRRFERWVEKMREIEDARTRGDGTALLDGEEVVFVGELDSSWKDDCAGLVRKLDGWRRQLRELGEDPDGHDEAGEPSSLSRILQASRSLVHDMLAELAIMDEIVREALQKEDEWIRGMIDDQDAGDDTPRAGAIWRVV
jgi:hypothetical protein